MCDYVSSSIPSALFGVSSNSVLFLVNSSLKINQRNIMLALRSRNKDTLEYCNSAYILVASSHLLKLLIVTKFQVIVPFVFVTLQF